MQPEDEQQAQRLTALARVRVVLVETSHPGNIGAAARAMKVMGLTRLYLVQPQQYPCAEATARASGADDLLTRAQVCTSLDEALQGCTLVLGASARLRTLPWPIADARSAAERAATAALAGEEVALIFGREHSGLTNQELERCHYLLNIPANAGYSSLNLAAAVQVVSYEMRMALLGAQPLVAEEADYAGAEELDSYYRHLEQTLIDIGFLDPANPRLVMRRMRRLYNRARLERTELNILRGILTETQKRVRR